MGFTNPTKQDNYKRFDEEYLPGVMKKLKKNKVWMLEKHIKTLES
jgi:hypothetical protein